MNALGLFLSGALFIVVLLTSIQFLRFWRKTHDRFFLFLSMAFALLALERLLIAFWGLPAETASRIYLIRLFAFLLLLFAIFEKNWGKRERLVSGDSARADNEH